MLQSVGTWLHNKKHHGNLMCKNCILPFLKADLCANPLPFLLDVFGIHVIFPLPAEACALLIYNLSPPGFVIGAFQWERLEEDIRKKLKDPDKTEHVLEKVKCVLKTPGKVHLTPLGHH